MGAIQSMKVDPEQAAPAPQASSNTPSPRSLARARERERAASLLDISRYEFRGNEDADAERYEDAIRNYKDALRLIYQHNVCFNRRQIVGLHLRRAICHDKLKQTELALNEYRLALAQDNESIKEKGQALHHEHRQFIIHRVARLLTRVPAETPGKTLFQDSLAESKSADSSPRSQGSTETHGRRVSSPQDRQLHLKKSARELLKRAWEEKK